MRPRAVVADIHATHLMLRTSHRRISDRAIGLAELCSRNPCHIGPMVLSGVEIQTLVQIDTGAKPLLVDAEEPAQPCAEERHQPFDRLCSRTSRRRLALIPPPHTARHRPREALRRPSARSSPDRCDRILRSRPACAPSTGGTSLGVRSFASTGCRGRRGPRWRRMTWRRGAARRSRAASCRTRGDVSLPPALGACLGSPWVDDPGRV